MIDDSTQATLNAHGFEPIQFIGQGGFAEVFTVKWNAYPNQTFVAKVIKMNKDYDRLVDSYMTEINALKKLYHKNILKFFSYYRNETHMVIIMEYCSNGTLQHYVDQNGPLNEVEFKLIAKQCLEALKACHDQEIAHRDIKPSNIMIDGTHKVKLCDFGISEDHISKLSRFDGSLAFLSPEVVEKTPYDPYKLDIWSLGVTFYYLVTGKLPWSARSKEELISAIKIGMVSYPAGVQPMIARLINIMMRKNPESRPSVNRLLDDDLFVETSKLSKSCAKFNLITMRTLKPRKKNSLCFNKIRSAYTCSIIATFEENYTSST